jgi:protein tyrosine phosphatase
MTKESQLRCDLLRRRNEIISKIRKNDMSAALDVIVSTCDPYKLPRSEYDISRCTPYSDEVSRVYSLKEYVNASFIPTAQNLFIAAQNPKPTKEELFLELIMRSNTKLVVSLIDDAQYFKEEALVSREAIRLDGRELFYDETYDLDGQHVRRLRYMGWIDFSTIGPEEMEAFHSYFNEIRSGVVLVHCLAGVGRTGTFIMYDILKNMKEVTLDSFVDVLLELRSRRSLLVTNAEQLGFLLASFCLECDR